MCFRILPLWLLCAATAIVWVTLLPCDAQDGRNPDFGSEVKPLLSDKCYHCHGPDAHTREAGLRLDTKEGAFALLESGKRAIVPGDSGASALVQRIAHSDSDEVMPPTTANLQLSSDQIDTLTRWIDAGAGWSAHWAFVPPAMPVTEQPTEHSPIDQLIGQKLHELGFSSSPEAPKATLIRRLSLDLRGLPPSLEEVTAFVNDSSDDAWEKLAERYLASVHTAERLAMDWLDAARYADTNGYSIDDHRDMWAWRDWVIDAFDRNLPYDQFLTQQLAGDLIPDATPKQVMATGFLRNSMNTHEGGTIPEEYRVAYIADKVDTVATAFMGLTMKCAQCHDHKYDPVAMRDYYRFFAFFNTTDEPGQGPGSGGNAKPTIEVESPFFGKEALQNRSRARSEWLSRAHSEETKSFEKEVDYFNTLADSGTTTVMVMNLKPRETFMLERGEYSKPGERVTAGTPGSLPPLKTAGDEATRLDLAHWLTQPDHPLTARVAVNRYWQFLFGTGLVKTAEDFGSQGEPPSHPELLDWLAVRFVKSGWDVKALLREMVMSDTYKQITTVSPELLEADPENRLLGRAPRHRLPAEIVRDNALAISGLLVRDVGGPGVYPYQPEGLWKEVSHYGPHAFTAMAYWQGTGSEHYRRSMYTFWKRTSPPPSLMAFDAPSRETCTIRRQNTNTPIQALVLMNDPQFVEASRALAARMLSEVQNQDPIARLTYGFQLAAARQPTTDELTILQRAVTRNEARFRKNPIAASSLLTVGELPPSEIDPIDHATYTMAASILLNLDETITEP